MDHFTTHSFLHQCTVTVAILCVSAIKKMMTFADSPGILVTFLSTGPQLKEIVLLQTEQTVSIYVYHLKDVRQHLPVVQQEQHREMSAQDNTNMPTSVNIFTHVSIHSFIQLLW